MLRRGCASVQYRRQRRAHCHSHMLSVPRHLSRARQVANALAAAYRGNKPRTACDQDICLPKRRICNAIWLAETTLRATWRYAAMRGWIARPVWCRGLRAAYHTLDKIGSYLGGLPPVFGCLYTCRAYLWPSTVATAVCPA